MVITRLHIDGFGLLVEEDFEFQPGLNLIFGPNEAGKSTLQQAILAMLYGFYQKDRLSAREKSLHARYRPWVGTQYGGSIRVRLDDGTTYLITRRFDSPEPETQIFAVETGEEVTGHFLRKRRGYVDFCERHLGMSRRVFTAVACVRQGQMASISERDAQEMSDAILRLFDSGTMDVSARTVLDRLVTAIRSLGTEKSRSGPWFHARQTIAEGEAALEKRKSLTLSLETDYRKAHDLERELVSCEQEKAEIELRLKAIERTELCQLLEKYQEVVGRRKKLEAQLRGGADIHVEREDMRDEGLRLLEEIRHIRKRRQELFDEIDTLEHKRATFRRSLEALPVELEFWYGDGPLEFLDIDREWQRLHLKLRESKVEQENLQRLFGEAGFDTKIGEKIQQLDANKIEEMRGTHHTLEEQQELLESIEEEIDDRKRYSRLSRFAVGIALSILLILALLIQAMPDANLSVFLRDNIPNALEYLALGIIALWAAFEVTTVMSIKTLETDQQNAIHSLRLLQNDLKEMLDPFGVSTFDALLNLKLRYVDIQKASETVAHNLQSMEEVNGRMQQWMQRFGFSEVSQENVNRIEEIIQEGRRILSQMQKLNDEMAMIDTELAKKDERLERVTLHLKNLLTEAGCWSGNLEDDAERFIKLVDMVRGREAARRELAQLQAREAELLNSMSIEEIQERLEQLDAEVGELSLDPEVHSKKVLKARSDALTAHIHEVKLELATLRERISERENQMPDLSEIEESMAEAQAQIDELTLKRRALELAFETLSEVARQAHRNFGPRLAHHVGTLLAETTGGRYQELYIDPADFSIKVARGKGKTLVPVDLLSFGTQEQLYLLLRSAIAEMFCTTGEKVPLLLDDPLVHADDRRQTRMLDTLGELANRQQILYFTKDQHLIDALASTKREYNLIILSSREERAPLRWAAGSALRR